MRESPKATVIPFSFLLDEAQQLDLTGERQRVELVEK
ncbi:hypothetical protein V1279_007588 [Bradyrhizobium sp. AZCC 1610]